MATAKLISLQVSDLVEWFRKRTLVVNETFQRHSVWAPAAKTFLIDTILCGLPIPKIYIRTAIDPTTQSSIREIVDGQQRIRTIVAFANNELRLTSRSEDWSSCTYEDLDAELQQKFLGYTVGVEQLLNATDDDVIDVFARLNSYTVSLNAAELRHARFQTEFKWAVRKMAHDFLWFWDKHGIFTTRERFRMNDDILIAEIFGVLLKGVVDGGQRNVTALYEEQDDDTFTVAKSSSISKKASATLSFLDKELGEALSGTFSKHYQVLIMAAAYAHHTWGIPKGQVGKMPARHKLASPGRILQRLERLDAAIEEEEPAAKYEAWVDACSASTHRMTSRNIRFIEIAKAFADRP